MMTSRQHLTTNPSSIKTRFAYLFLRNLKRLNKYRPTSSSSRAVYQRYGMIKFAADASMASAVGSRRAWSRATLLKIRNRALNCTFLKRRRIHALRRRRAERKSRNPRQECAFGQANELRRLVPGGEVMDICNLLDETAHYIKCLNTQVQVMRNIVDFYSS
ncbi:unnamed protein product [Ilex paraguariensis]|uniref:IBH1-like N-terminal domain-containing protein n=1 Tax=Ilex paraguariensis TaxID=185542 RepID=A0ABC8R948_9AQUA